MIAIYFYYQGEEILLNCTYNMIMREVIKQFFCKMGIHNTNSFFFIYNGNIVKENLTVEQIVNSFDKSVNKMTIIASSNDDFNSEIFQKNNENNKDKIIINITYSGCSSKFEFEQREKMGKVVETFFNKSGLNNTDSIFFLYSGSLVDKNLIIKKILNFDDKSRKKMDVLAYNMLEESGVNKSIIKKSKQIICPTCGESAKIKIKNCKLSICECKLHHNKDFLDINEFKSSQLINESTIICGKCKERNKGNTYNNVFYVCNSCKLNLCPLCQYTHNKTHNCIDYDNKNLKCSKHNELFSSYCNTCKENICTLCTKDHGQHYLISYSKLFIKSNDLEKKLKEFKISIEKLKEDIEKIKGILNKVFNYCENFYKFIDVIIHNFDMKNINYENLINLKEIYNEDLSKKLDNIINDKNYTHKITHIFEIYNNINNNELNIDDQSAKNLNESGVNMKNNNNKEKELMEEISKKNSEIERLLSLMPFKLNPGEKLMTVIFISEDQKVHYSFICKNTDKFNELESRLYDIYPEYSEEDNYFLANGRKIVRFKDLDYNRIKNSDIITLCSGF